MLNTYICIKINIITAITLLNSKLYIGKREWIFKSILEGKEYIPSNMEKLDIILEHINNALEYEDKKQATLKLRKHIAWYLKGMDGSTKIKDTINREDDIDKVKEILKNYFYNLK